MTKRNRVSGLVKVSTPVSAAPEIERKWRAESALRTISDAAKIHKDKALMRDVKKIAREQQKQLAAVCKGSSSGRR